MSGRLGKAAGAVKAAATKVAKAVNMTLILFKAFQEPIFWNESKTIVLHWSRQIGKSYVLAAWAVYRIVTKLIQGKPWLVCVLSNSKDNGTEFMQKVREICGLLRISFEAEDLSPDDLIENMRIECRITIAGREGRIKVLAANPRTARGFSGDLILDEFAFHEDSYAIWDAAEPILASNEEFQCRIASTGNGCYNMFYQMVAGATVVASQDNPAGLSVSNAGFLVSRVPRSSAYAMGQKVYDLKTGEEITPEQARERSLDKASYDQNYELAFNDEAMALLTQPLINRAEYKVIADEPEPCFIDSQEWGQRTLDLLRRCKGPLGVGVDVGRNRDLTVIDVSEKEADMVLTRGVLRLANVRLPEQKRMLGQIIRLPNFGRAEIDMTGIGLGLVEFTQEEVGEYRVAGVHFASKEMRDPTKTLLGKTTHKTDTALVTELMALDLLELFEDGRIRIPCEAAYRDALRKPQRITTASGVRIAATSDDAGHADEFWAKALAVRALKAPAQCLGNVSGIRMGTNCRSKFKPRTLRRLQHA